MFEAFSTPRNKIVTFIFLMICGVLAVIAASMGVDDNPPGILLAFLAANAFILAFVHPWRTARKFLFFLLASAIGFILFVGVNIILDTAAQDPTTAGPIRNLIESPTANVINVSLFMLCPAALVIGILGSVIMYIRNRRQ